MQKSTETRWNLTSEEVKIAENWFKNFGEKFLIPKSFPRQDYYVKTNTNTLGIKIREPKLINNEQKSKLEVKILVGDNGVQNFYNNNEGKVNTWIKHSFETIGNEPEIEKIISSFAGKESDIQLWIKIEKDRLLVKFDATENKIVSSKSMIDEGSGIELTHFTLGKENYFSLGIESFSSTNIEEENFIKTVKFLFEDMQISGLTSLKSLSYPEIITNHIQ